MNKLFNKLCWVIVVSLLTVSVQASERPNVIIMLADDLGWADVGFHGNQQIDTPSLDRLAAEGVQLDRFYTTPICSPTRAALMTGRDPMRLGIAYGVIMPWHNNGVHPDETFLPELFLNAGYQTAMVGKWHLGHAQQSYHPNNRGFEHFYGHLHTEVGYFPPFANQGGKDFQRNGESLNDEGYETFLLGDEVSRYIRERDKSKPFFVYMPFIAPHTPLEAPEDLVEKYADLKDNRESSRSRSTEQSQTLRKLAMMPSARPMFAAVVDAMDQAIGNVLQTLDEEQLTNDTIVLFFSDNGGAAYAMGGAYNAPLRGGKGDTFEGGIRVVSVMRWPEEITAGGKMTSIMTAMDVLPTLAAAAGIEPTTKFKLDGHNMLSAIVEGEAIPRDEFVFFASETPIQGQFSVTAFNDEWKLVQDIRRGLSSYDIENFLFNMKEDPYEYTNLASKYPQRVADMAKAIRRWRSLSPISATRHELVPPPGWRAPLDWVSYPRQLDTLQATPAPGMPPASALKMLDWQHGEAGRLVYDCEPYALVGGGLCKN